MMRTSKAGPLAASGPSTAADPYTAAGSSTAASRAAPSDSAVARPSTSTRAPAGNTGGQLIRQVEDAMMSATVDNDGNLLAALQWRLNELTTHHGRPNRVAIIRLAVQFLVRAGLRASARVALIGLARESWDLDAALDRWELEADGEVEGDDGADEQDNERQSPEKKKQHVDSDDDDDDRDGGRGYVDAYTRKKTLGWVLFRARQSAGAQGQEVTETKMRLEVNFLFPALSALFQQCLEAVNRTL